MADIRAYFPPSRALVWKTPVVALAIVAGAIGAYATGWYGAA
jgi:hypothetical protein